MGQINTGIDKLVEIIKENKSISVVKASETLGVSTALIEEWGNFLEEEGIVKVEYKLSGTVLVERKITDKELSKREKEVMKRKDKLMENLKAAQESFNIQKEDIVEAQKEYKELAAIILKRYSNLKDDIDELTNLEKVSDELNQKLISHNREYNDKIGWINDVINKKYNKYNTLLAQLEESSGKIEAEKDKIKRLKDEEKLAHENLKNLHETISSIEKSLEQKNHNVADTLKTAVIVKDNIDEIRNELLSLKTNLDSLTKERNVKQKEIDKISIGIQRKIKDKTDEMEKETNKIKKKEVDFSNFINKKNIIKKLLHESKKDTISFIDEIDELSKEAEKFELINKSSDVKRLSKTLKDQYVELIKRQEKAHKEYQKLSSMFE